MTWSGLLLLQRGEVALVNIASALLQAAAATTAAAAAAAVVMVHMGVSCDG